MDGLGLFPCQRKKPCSNHPTQLGDATRRLANRSIWIRRSRSRQPWLDRRTHSDGRGSAPVHRLSGSVAQRLLKLPAVTAVETCTHGGGRSPGRSLATADGTEKSVGGPRPATSGCRNRLPTMTLPGPAPPGGGGTIYNQEYSPMSKEQGA